MATEFSNNFSTQQLLAYQQMLGSFVEVVVVERVLSAAEALLSALLRNWCSAYGGNSQRAIELCFVDVVVRLQMELEYAKMKFLGAQSFIMPQGFQNALGSSHAAEDVSCVVSKPCVDVELFEVVPDRVRLPSKGTVTSSSEEVQSKEDAGSDDDEDDDEDDDQDDECGEEEEDLSADEGGHENNGGEGVGDEDEEDEEDDEDANGNEGGSDDEDEDDDDDEEDEDGEDEDDEEDEDEEIPEPPNKKKK